MNREYYLIIIKKAKIIDLCKVSFNLSTDFTLKELLSHQQQTRV